MPWESACRGLAPGRIGSVSGLFFVGATDRCGVSQLKRVLGEHPQVHALKTESRFLVDPGGFEDLARLECWCAAGRFVRPSLRCPARTPERARQLRRDG